MEVARARVITDFGSCQCLTAAAAAGAPFAGAVPCTTDTRQRSMHCTQGWEPHGARVGLVTWALPASPAWPQAGLVLGGPGAGGSWWPGPLGPGAPCEMAQDGGKRGGGLQQVAYQGDSGKISRQEISSQRLNAVSEQ